MEEVKKYLRKLGYEENDIETILDSNSLGGYTSETFQKNEKFQLKLLNFT